MRSKYLLPFLFLPLLAACGDNEADGYAGDPLPDFALTHELAKSVWAQYIDESSFVDAEEVIPTDTTAADYDDYVENWIGTLGTRNIVITFKNDTATVNWMSEGKKTKAAVKITCKGAHVTIHNDLVTNGLADGRARMNYILRGETNNGSLRIYSNKKFLVTLDGVSITNPGGSAINAQKSLEKKRMFVNVKVGTENTLCDATQYTDTIAGEDEKGTLFSEGKLIFYGTGKLNVSGRNSHAIASDDRIRLHAGVNIEIDDAAKDGIHSKGAFYMSGGKLKVFASKDAIQSNTDPSVLNKGISLCGGLVQVCGNRAFNTESLTLNGAKVCAIYREETEPNLSLPYTIETHKGYSVLYTNP